MATSHARPGDAQGHTIGRLLLHGLHGEERERERSNLNAVAARAERNLHTRRNNLSSKSDIKAIQFDAEALPPCGAHGLARSIGEEQQPWQMNTTGTCCWQPLP